MYRHTIQRSYTAVGGGPVTRPTIRPGGVRRAALHSSMASSGALASEQASPCGAASTGAATTSPSTSAAITISTGRTSRQRWRFDPETPRRRALSRPCGAQRYGGFASCCASARAVRAATRTSVRPLAVGMNFATVRRRGAFRTGVRKHGSLTRVLVAHHAGPSTSGLKTRSACHGRWRRHVGGGGHRSGET